MGDTSSWRLCPHLPPPPQEKKIAFFLPIFEFCPRDASPKKILVPPLRTREPSGRPIKMNSKGVKSGDLGTTLPVQFQSVGASPIPPDSVNSLMCGQA